MFFELSVFSLNFVCLRGILVRYCQPPDSQLFTCTVQSTLWQQPVFSQLARLLLPAIAICLTVYCLFPPPPPLFILLFLTRACRNKTEGSLFETNTMITRVSFLRACSLVKKKNTRNTFCAFFEGGGKKHPNTIDFMRKRRLLRRQLLCDTAWYAQFRVYLWKRNKNTLDHCRSCFTTSLAIYAFNPDISFALTFPLW